MFPRPIHIFVSANHKTVHPWRNPPRRFAGPVSQPRAARSPDDLDQRDPLPIVVHGAGKAISVIIDQNRLTRLKQPPINGSFRSVPLISGKLSEALASMRLSERETVYENYKGPDFAVIEGVEIV